MDFYPSKNNNKLNGELFLPELVNGCAMVNPHYRVELMPGTKYIIDSGAFQERDMLCRLQPWIALDRQLRLEHQIEYSGHDGYAEAIITYDMLTGVDESIKMINGKERRIKERGNETTASQAVHETIRSARYYNAQVDRIRGSIAYAAQGASVSQYIDCIRAILPLIRPGQDWLAFGGFCIVGMMPGLKKDFYAVLDIALPLIKYHGIERAHILGVCVADVIVYASALEKAYGVNLSTDSSSVEQNSAIYGKSFDDGKWTKLYTKNDKGTAYQPSTWAIENITKYHQWITSL